MQHRDLIIKRLIGCWNNWQFNILLTLSIIIMSVATFNSCKNSAADSKLAIKEGFIQVTGGKIWYRIVGADRKGIPLLTLHGGPGAPHDYLEPLEALADERPVIFYDQLGCGNSDRPMDTSLWNINRFALELEQVRAALDLKEVHILGASWGTMLGVEYALSGKQGIKSLVLSGPFLSTSLWDADQQEWINQLPVKIRDTIRKYEANGEYSASSYRDAMMEYYKLHVCRLETWPDCINRTFEKMGVEVYQYMWGPSEFTMTGTLKGANLLPKLGSLKIPTLLTCGEFDEATPKTTKLYMDKIPGSEMHVFKGASHAHQLESKEEFLTLVRVFLRKNDVQQ